MQGFVGDTHLVHISALLVITSINSSPSDLFPLHFLKGVVTLVHLPKPLGPIPSGPDSGLWNRHTEYARHPYSWRQQGGDIHLQRTSQFSLSPSTKKMGSANSRDSEKAFEGTDQWLYGGAFTLRASYRPLGKAQFSVYQYTGFSSSVKKTRTNLQSSAGSQPDWVKQSPLHSICTKLTSEWEGWELKGTCTVCADM